MIESTESRLTTFDLSLLGFSFGNLLLCKVRELNQEDDATLYAIGCVASIVLLNVGMVSKTSAPAFKKIEWIFNPLGFVAFMSACIVNAVGLKVIAQQPVLVLKAAVFSAAWCGMRRLYSRCYQKKKPSKNGSPNDEKSFKNDLAIMSSPIVPLALTGQAILQRTNSIFSSIITGLVMFSVMELNRNWVRFKGTRTYSWEIIKVTIPLIACAGLVASIITRF